MFNIVIVVVISRVYTYYNLSKDIILTVQIYYM